MLHNGSKGSTIIETIGSLDITLPNAAGVCFIAMNRQVDSIA